MALPTSFDELTASIEREVDRAAEPMDYIKALYAAAVEEQVRIEGVAKAASVVVSPEPSPGK